MPAPRYHREPRIASWTCRAELSCSTFSPERDASGSFQCSKFQRACRVEVVGVDTPARRADAEEPATGRESSASEKPTELRGAPAPASRATNPDSRPSAGMNRPTPGNAGRRVVTTTHEGREARGGIRELFGCDVRHDGHAFKGSVDTRDASSGQPARRRWTERAACDTRTP